jgi:hypothetical protein
MTKQTGLGDLFFVDGYDVSGDINEVSNVHGGPNALPFTGINALGMERKGGLRDAGIAFISYFNPAASQAHPVLSALPRTDVIAAYWRGGAIGNQAAELVAKQVGYDGQRGEDGSYKLSVDTQGNAYGLDWCHQLTAGKRTDTTGTNGTGLDLTASTAFGLQAYLHVFAFTGTNVTVTIQESSDNAVGDPYAAVTGGAFTAMTGIGSQRIATARGLTVERYLRVTTTGTFTSVTFAVAVAKNTVSVVF